MGINVSSSQLELLDEFISEFMNVEMIPGIAVGIVHENEIIYKKGFGVKNGSIQAKVDEYSLFHMASIAKTFVALGVMQLVSEQKIQLDEYVVNYLPYFQLKDERYHNITIRHLLTHNSGLPNEPDLEWDKPQYDKESLERYVKGLHQKDLLSAPGETFSYSDMAYDILGDVVAKRSGLTFEEYMDQNILKKLHMNHSNFLRSELSEELLTSPHLCYEVDSNRAKVSDVFPYNRIHAPSSTLCSNVVDMCNYLIYQIDLEKRCNEHILESNSLCFKDLWIPQVQTGWGGYQDQMGLGWFLGEYKGYKVRSHEGGDTGFRSHMMILPDQELGIVIMTNSDYVGCQYLCPVVLDVVLGIHQVNRFQNSLAHHLSRLIIQYNYEHALQEYIKIQISDSIDLYYVDENEFLSLSHEWKKAKRWEDTISLLQLSMKIFPHSMSLLDRLEEVYMLKGQPVQIINREMGK